MAEEKPESMLAVRGIKKSFGNNTVLKGVDLDLFAGEVLALIGGNGAGKSTMMKIVMGIHQPDEGEIHIAGKCVRLNKPSAALAHGVYLVPQEPMLFPHMSVEENVLMGFSDKRKELHKRLIALISHLGWGIDVRRKAASLSIAEQQLVELLRGLMRNVKILILDEPTSSLTFNEVQSLFKIIEELKKKDIGIIHITHRLNEVFEIATRVAIMSDGYITLNGPVGDFTHDMLVNGLLPENFKKRESAGKVRGFDRNSADPVLSVEKLCGNGFSDITLQLYPGEILGLAGVVGAGRTEFATTIFGRDAVKSGRVYLDKDEITGKSTKQVMEMGLAYVAEDRFLNGIYKISDVAANTSASSLRKLGRFLLDFKKERKMADRFIEAFRTKVTGRDQVMGSLSGGNQQKVVIARSLAIQPKLLILDEPTRGIDAAARGDVYAIIQDLKAQGLAILLISSDMEEILELSDRAMTMYLGRINKEFRKEEISQESLMAAAFGVIGEGMNHE
ncbi:MAG: ABC transporter ATP-binding protein [Treponema sp. GWB1_62_6]|nr:MAG: ABC transporter ATP-binding protein [Treponema sp. GWA1_62_8]OHE64690.1 MAG: ABC transporter ATP-binding protein [Treponema sp. GWC1_61_84]OHE72333.1 MAG: ABC transporter ATP-binding protein [Treponema sp. GWB1_62_6]OHE75600.1 MAG: ABC transporter ATP-binding protein [Treponema sp. RIFOXYC1_FULL_61_9]HCM27522.1 ABC transporter ATP-binding protein [Treponema sp.]